MDGRSVHAGGTIVKDREGEQYLLAGFLSHRREGVQVSRLKYGLWIDFDQEVTAADSYRQCSQGHAGGRCFAAAGHRKKNQQDRKAAHGSGFLF